MTYGPGVIEQGGTLHSQLTGVNRRVDSATLPDTSVVSSKLWLTVWAGEVLNAYDQYISFEPHVNHRTIANGTEIKFPLTGTVSLKPQWGAGEELAGGGGPSTEVSVTLDDRPMAAHFELDNPDMMISQWEYRSEMARQTGMTLANTSDKQIASLIAQAACKMSANALTAVGTDRMDPDDLSTGIEAGTGGQVYSGDGDATGSGGDGTDTSGTTRGFNYAELGTPNFSGNTTAKRTSAALGLLEDIEHFFVHLQELNAPTEGVVCCVSPQAFQDIRALNIARASSDFANGGGHPFFGGGATDMGGLGAPLTAGMHGLQDILMYQGCTIMKTNHGGFFTDYTSASIGDAKYNKDLSKLAALIWQPDAVARLSLQGMKVDSVEDVRRNTHFTVASTFKGGGTLRTECAGAMLIDVA
jgi:hypothetical protein